jgi:hypothetical protein
MDWAETARACDLPNVHAFTRGLDLEPSPPKVRQNGS